MGNGCKESPAVKGTNHRNDTVGEASSGPRDAERTVAGLERELREAWEAVEKANAGRSAFLANMSHEIRTPMTGIFGMVQLLQSTHLSSRQAEYLEALNDAAKSLLSVIDDILDFSKIEAGKVGLNHEPFILGDCLGEVIALHQPRITAKKLEFSLSVAPSVPEVLYGDPARLKQVVSNLIANAAKFTERGKITLSVTAEVVGQETALLHFCLRDTGIGLSSQLTKDLFRPFTQADRSVTRKYGGTGLGLAISKGLVELMGGNIWAESAEGEGAAFYFSARVGFPLRQESPVKRERPAPEPLAGSGFKILVAEDDRISRRLIEQAVQRNGFSVTLAKNGREAVEMLSSETFDAVLMDVSMPELDGISATRELRAFPENHPNRTIPVIALTAHAYLEDRQRCLDAGMSDVIVKPFLFDALRDVLTGHLRDRESRLH